MNSWEVQTIMIGYEREIIHRELSRLQRDIARLLSELPETGTPEQLPKDCVTGMAIAYKLLSAMIGARIDRVTRLPQDKRYHV